MKNLTRRDSKIMQIAPLTLIAGVAAALNCLLSSRTKRPVQWAGWAAAFCILNPFNLFPAAQLGGYIDDLNEAAGYLVKAFRGGLLRRRDR